MTFFRATGFHLIESLESASISLDVWGVRTNTFVPVSAVMYSPNYWDDNRAGNKHLFFILQGCKNLEPARGFFNEFLRGDLTEHRKVFEILGNKMKAPPADDQLSGVGFSTTQRNQVVLRSTGKVTRTLKVLF